MCKNEFLHYLRIREWQDLHAQLRSACRSVRIDPDVATSAPDAEPDWDAIHKALLAGLLSHVGARDQAKREYAGARGARFGISPGSALFRKQPDLVMAAELVETSRLWARVNAAIEPEWAEEVGAHVVARTVSEPRWSRKAGAAVATERVTLFGVPLVTDRTIQYARIDAEAAREIFIRSAFVEGDWEPQHDFWKRNVATLARVAELEERARRRDIVVDDEVLFAFYDARIPPDVPTERHFDRWWRGERRRRPDLLTLTEDDLTSEAGEQVSAADYPRTWRQGDLDLDVTYQFSPGEAADGVTVHVPVAVLNRVTSDGFDWQVPGLRDDLAIALLKSLPKATRRHFVPTPDHAMAALAAGRPGARHPHRGAGAGAPRAHRRPHPAGGVGPRRGYPTTCGSPSASTAPAAGSWPAARTSTPCATQAGGAVRAGMARAGASLERSGLTGWTVGEVPETFEGRSGGLTVEGYPALVDEGTSVALRVLPDRGAARAAHRRGVRRLLLLNTSAPWKRVLARLSQRPEAGAGRQPARLGAGPAAGLPRRRRRRHRRRARAGRGAHAGVLRRRPRRRAHPRRDPGARRRRGGRAGARARGPGAPHPRGARARRRLGAHRRDPRRRPGPARQPRAPRLRRRHRGGPAARRAALPARDAAPPRAGGHQPARAGAPGAGRRRGGRVRRPARVAARRPGAASAEVTDIGWMVEELRVSLFAQTLGTAGPVSEKRVRAAIAAVTAAR